MTAALVLVEMRAIEPDMTAIVCDSGFCMVGRMEIWKNLAMRVIPMMHSLVRRGDMSRLNHYKGRALAEIQVFIREIEISSTIQLDRHRTCPESLPHAFHDRHTTMQTCSSPTL